MLLVMNDKMFNINKTFEIKGGDQRPYNSLS